jgi:signal transduction histidine kinase
MRSLPSLRLWLLSTSTLSVIAGYALLLGVNGLLARQQRLQAHQQLVAALRAQPSQSHPITAAAALFGVEVSVLTNGEEQSPVLEQSANGDAWLVSATPLPPTAGSTPVLLVRQNVTDSLGYERTLQLLLIAAAGVSTLLTAALLRLVLWRGLVQPLKGLSEQLDGISADALGDHLIAVDDQPQELQPIAAAFNGLQQRLAAAWQRERRFVDGVAHELRTPITLISGRSQRLLRKPHPPEQEQSLAQIAQEASRMAALISALLELARSDAGRLDIQRQAVDPEQVVLEAFERLQPLAPQRLQLAPAGAHALPDIEADPERLQQCLLALVDNALAFSSGSVQLVCSRDRSSEAVWVTVHVLDQGPVIPTKERTAVLERFARGSTASGTRGSGIGLAVVDELSRAMGAELVIADRRGGGADLQLRFQV